MEQKKEKLIIYQVFPRIFTNTNVHCVHDGTLQQNGSGKMNHFTAPLLRSLREMGVNCVWYTGIIEHATKTPFLDAGIPGDNPHVVKGEAGSPYAIRDYYDVDPAIAEVTANRMQEFEALVRRTHQAGMKCIIDFVPNHTARVYHSDVKPAGVKDFGVDDDITMHFSPHNNYYYSTNQQFSPSFDISSGQRPYREFPAKATGNDCFTAFCGETDWYETAKLNYGHDYGDNSDHFDPIPPTWKQMRDILLYWCSKKVDGFRCDMVFMVPLEFWHWVTAQVRAKYPDTIFIGEIYDVGLYRPFLDYGGFDYLYDKVNLYDTLVGIETKGYSAAQLTGCWQTVEGISGRMLNFLENHDEVRFASRAYAGNPSRAIPALIVSSMISTGPFMIYYGQELGERGTDNEGFAGDNDRTTIFDYWSYSTMRRWYHGGLCDGELLNQHERWLRNTYTRILNLCNQREEIREGKLFDLMYVNLRNPAFNPHHHYAFFRHHKGKVLLIVANFDTVAANMEINIPKEAFDTIGMKEGRVDTLDLYDGCRREVCLSLTQPVKVKVEGSNALVLAFETSAIKPFTPKEEIIN